MIYHDANSSLFPEVCFWAYAEKPKTSDNAKSFWPFVEHQNRHKTHLVFMVIERDTIR